MVRQGVNSRASQTEGTYERLRKAILAGDYLPGSKLRIGEIRERMQGNLGAVREALSRLLAEGLVLSEPFKGFAVAPVSPEDLIQLTEARIKVEKLCLASALANGGLEWEGQLLALLHRLLRTTPPNEIGAEIEEWWHVHTEFHETLVSACDNCWLLRMHRTLYEQSERYRRLALMMNVAPAPNENGVSRDTGAEHKELVEAALARDVDRINSIIEVHLRRTTDHLLERLEKTAFNGNAKLEVDGPAVG